MYEVPYGRNLSSAGNPLPRTKHHVDRQTRCEVMAIFLYPRWSSAGILDFIEPEIAPIDPLAPKILTWGTKHGVGRMHRFQDIRL